MAYAIFVLVCNRFQRSSFFLSFFFLIKKYLISILFSFFIQLPLSITDKRNNEYINSKLSNIASIIGCLSDDNEETVLNAVTTLMFLITPASKKCNWFVPRPCLLSRVLDRITETLSNRYRYRAYRNPNAAIRLIAEPPTIQPCKSVFGRLLSGTWYRVRQRRSSLMVDRTSIYQEIIKARKSCIL